MINQATQNGCVGVLLQKPGGAALPSIIEKNIGQIVKFLRERQVPVFPDRVMKLTADAKLLHTPRTAYRPKVDIKVGFEG